MARERIEIKPQPGPQYAFLASKADIALYGGAAFGGKTFALLLDPLRHYNNPKFDGVCFRRNVNQVRNPGGLWDESMKIYSLLRGVPKESTLDWRFPSGASMCFAHLEYEKDVFNWQGSQLGWIGFDELTHFSRTQFFYMLSRLRSAAGIKTRIRATMNPDPDSWVREFIDWWIDKDGFAIPERSGKLRWFIRQNDEMIWADSKEELHQRFGDGPEVKPLSVTFIAAKLEDNKIGMAGNPGYEANLLGMNRVDRERLRNGNWNIREASGELFKRQWFPIIEAIPGGWKRVVRFWDRAATKPNPQNPNPDWTRGLLLYQYADGTFVVGDLASERDTPGAIENLIKTTATQDGRSVAIRSQRDPGSAGVSESEHFVKMLQGYDVGTAPMSGDKVTRAKPVSAQAEAGNIRLQRAAWNKDFFSELEAFPSPKTHDDIVDAFSGAFNELAENAVGSFAKVAAGTATLKAPKSIEVAAW